MTLSYDAALTLLLACKPLVARLLEAEGIYTALNTAEMQVLEGFATVGQSGLLEEGAQATSLRRQAELRPSDLGMLMGRLAQEQWQRDPEGVMMEIRAMLNGARNRADLS